jgi:hypothetical protein
VAQVAGGFGKKTRESKVYWYCQAKLPVGKLQQVYVDPDDEARRETIRRHDAPTAKGAKLQLERLSGAAAALGCYEVIRKHACELARLAQYGLFRAGGILVGTHAYLVYQNTSGSLGEGRRHRRPRLLRTRARISVPALPATLHVDVPSAHRSVKMGFIPVTGTRYDLLECDVTNLLPQGRYMRCFLC